MISSQLQICLVFSSLLFCVGLAGALSRSNSILVLLGIELMLNAANLNFIAFWRYGPALIACHRGHLRDLSVAVAAAEAAVGLALVIAVYRWQKNIRLCRRPSASRADPSPHELSRPAPLANPRAAPVGSRDRRHRTPGAGQSPPAAQHSRHSLSFVLSSWRFRGPGQPVGAPGFQFRLV